MTDYYAERLSGRRLMRCYELAPPRVRQYLEAEIRHALGRIGPGDAVLELGCGYGRVALRFAQRARMVVGVDVAEDSLELARELAGSSCEFLRMDACDMTFDDGTFDVVACLQNGICAFDVPVGRLVSEAVRVARPGGRVLFSSYAERFWEHRLSWFELQAEEGLLGPIDRQATREGVIACEDGFRSGAMSPEDFGRVCGELGLAAELTEVDGSSLFCEIVC